MNILQFESLNLEFICKIYEINKFGIRDLGRAIKIRRGKSDWGRMNGCGHRCSSPRR
jgi:hypothetical protein